MAWDHVSSALDGRESAFELHASGGVPAWRGRLRRSFERYNELANAVLRALNMDMPDIDLSSIREVPWAPAEPSHRRHHPLKGLVNHEQALPELPGGETGPLRQSGKLEPGDAGMGIVKPHSGGGKPTIGAGNNVLSPDHSGEPHDAFGDEFWVLHQVGGVTDDPGDEDFPSGSFTCSKTWYSCSCRGLAASNE